MDHKAVIQHLFKATRFRFEHAVKNRGEEFGNLNVGSGVRTPTEIIHHMYQVIAFARWRMGFGDKAYRETTATDLDQESQRFIRELQKAEQEMNGLDLEDEVLLRLLQGPLTDVLTHVGQIAMLMRMDGNPVEGLNYYRSEL